MKKTAFLSAVLALFLSQISSAATLEEKVTSLEERVSQIEHRTPQTGTILYSTRIYKIAPQCDSISPGSSYFGEDATIFQILKEFQCPHGRYLLINLNQNYGSPVFMVNAKDVIIH